MNQIQTHKNKNVFQFNRTICVTDGSQNICIPRRKIDLNIQ